LVRPEPEVATYFEGRKPVLREVVKLLIDRGDFNVVVIPRTVKQRKLYGKLGAEILDEVTVEHPVAYADVVLGAAETMLMEAFVLGIPTISAVYWKPSKPVAYLHAVIPHSVDKKVIVEYAYKFIDNKERARFAGEAKNIVVKMDNPIEVILNQLNREIIKG
jgi:predicted glycosyltransferase